MPIRMGSTPRHPGVPYGTTRNERVTMARALASLYGAGGLLVIITILLPHGSSTQAWGVLGPGLLALLVSAALLRFAGDVAVSALQVLLALGAVLITSCVVYGGEASTAYPFLYVWVALYSYYFFSLRMAASQIAFCAALYALSFVLQDDTPVPSVHWLMATGTILVGGLLIGHLTASIRAQADDLATVSRMAGTPADVKDFSVVTCDSLRASTGADVVLFLEPREAGGGLHVKALSGDADVGRVFDSDRAWQGLQTAFRGGEPVVITTSQAEGPWKLLGGHVRGLAQPVLHHGSTAAVLAVAWTTPRRSMPERLRTAAVLFAAEASLAMERAERDSQDRERAALEINDNIVQGLAIAKYWAQRGQTEESIQAIDETLGRARRLITDQLQRVAHGRTTATRLRDAVPPPLPSPPVAPDVPPPAPVSAEQ